MLTVVVNGEQVVVARQSLRIRKAIEQRDSASFVVIDKEGALAPDQGNVVEITENGDPVFSGVIDAPEKVSLSPSGGFLHTLHCVDWHYLADKRIAARSYLDTSAGGVVRDLMTTYLVAEGVSEGEIQDGPVLKQVAANYVKVSNVFDSIAEKSGFIWYIDEDKKLYFVDRATNAAPWTAEYPYILDNPQPILSEGNSFYRNRQYVKGAQAVTALQTETRTGDGETKSFALGFPLAKEPVIAVAGVTKIAGIKGLETGKDWYWSKDDNTIYSEIAPAIGAVIEVNYYGQYRIVSLSYNNAEITRLQGIEGGTGYVDDVVDSPEDSNKEAAFETANGKLLKYCREAQKFVYATKRSGLKPGQLQSINHVLTGEQDMLIESVVIDADGDDITYTVNAVTGPEAEDWKKFFARLADKRTAIEKLNLGEVEILIILAQNDDIWRWDEDVTMTVFSCPVPSSSLHPSTTLYPC